MNTLGWILILMGLMIWRAVSKGRVMNIGEDTSDAFLAIVQGDNKALMEVLGRVGESNKIDFGYDEIAKGAALTAVGTGQGIGQFANEAGTAIDNLNKGPHAFEGLAVAAIILGDKAKGYRWEGVGPDYYDCSGLMWRACQKLGYKGSRFTTATIRGRKGFELISPPGMQGPGVIAAGMNDMVLWPAGSGGITGHIGVLVSATDFYSARSVRSGIGTAKVSTFRKTRPLYIRYTGA